MDKILNLYLIENKASWEIAKELNISLEYLFQHLREQEVTLKKPTKEELELLYQEQRKTVSEIAILFNFPISNIYYFLKKYNIRKGKLTQVLLYDLYTNKKFSIVEISKRLHSSETTISKYLKKYNIKTRTIKYKEFSKELLEELYFHKKIGIVAIAKELKCSPSIIYKKFKEYNIQRRKPKSKKPKLFIPETILIDLYVNQKLSINEIGKKIHHSQEMITRSLEKYGIKIRHSQKTYTKPERLVAEYFTQKGIKYIFHYSLNKFVFDFYLPNLNEFVEVNGTFWHADPRFWDRNNLKYKPQKESVERDNKKISFAKENGLKLIFLWEYDILQNDFANFFV